MEKDKEEMGEREEEKGVEEAEGERRFERVRLWRVEV